MVRDTWRDKWTDLSLLILFPRLLFAWRQRHVPLDFHPSSFRQFPSSSSSHHHCVNKRGPLRNNDHYTIPLSCIVETERKLFVVPTYPVILPQKSAFEVDWPRTQRKNRNNCTCTGANQLQHYIVDTDYKLFVRGNQLKTLTLHNLLSSSTQAWRLVSRPSTQ